MDFKELMARMAELDQPVQEADTAGKDYDGDGEVESGKDEYMGSRDKAIKKAMGKDDEEDTKESLDLLADELQQDMDECGMSPMSSMPSPMSKQQDNVSMNLSMNGSGSGGIRDLMNILRNIEKGADDHDHGDMPGMLGGGDDDPEPMKMIMKKEPVLGDEYANSPDELVAPMGAAVPGGDDLHKPKGAYPKVAGGDNPMALENLKSRLNSMYERVKSN
jgi:hypothetical protein